jgi:hypothetical protein
MNVCREIHDHIDHEVVVCVFHYCLKHAKGQGWFKGHALCVCIDTYVSGNRDRFALIL